MAIPGQQDVIADWAINFGGRLDDLRQDLATMVTEVNGSTAQVETRARVTGGAFTAMGRLATNAFGFIVRGATLATGALIAMKAAVDLEELANRRLARSFDIAGDSAQGAVDDFNDFASELDQFTSLSENKLRKLGAIGATIGKLTGEDLKQATVAAVGLAARYEHVGLKAEQAQRMIARAANGDFSGFERLGIHIDENLSGMEKYNLVIAEGLKGLEDAEDQANTTTGGMRRLLGAVSELAATAGRLIGLDSQAGGFLELAIDGVERLTDWLESLQDTVDRTFEKVLRFFGFDFGSAIGIDTIVAQVTNIGDSIITQIRVWGGHASNAILEWINLLPDPVKEVLFGAGGDLTAGGMAVDVEGLERELDERQRRRLREAQEAQDRRMREAEKSAKEFADQFRFNSGRGIGPDTDRTRDTVQSVIGTFRIPGADEANRIRRQILKGMTRILFFLDREGRPARFRTA